MNPEPDMYLGQVTGEWHAEVMGREFIGTRDQCLQWLCEQQSELIELAQDLHQLILRNGFLEPQSTGERRSQ